MTREVSVQKADHVELDLRKPCLLYLQTLQDFIKSDTVKALYIEPLYVYRQIAFIDFFLLFGYRPF